jgi:hypothetical protein
LSEEKEKLQFEIPVGKFSAAAKKAGVGKIFV